jgi:hypothetical protein
MEENKEIIDPKVSNNNDGDGEHGGHQHDLLHCHCYVPNSEVPAG